jgi:uncharacterized membrane protein YesL
VRVRGWLREAWDLIGADLPLFTMAAFLTISLSLLSAFILALPLLVGLCIMFLEKLNGRQPELKHLWEGITQHFPASIVVYMIYMLASVPFDAANVFLQTRAAPCPTVGILTVLVGLWLIGTPLFFCLPLIADRDLSARDALRLSWARVRTQPLNILLNVIVCSIVALFGLFACGLGLIITLPLVVATLVLAYRDLVGNFAAPQMTSLREEIADEVDDDEAS